MSVGACMCGKVTKKTLPIQTVPRRGVVWKANWPIADKKQSLGNPFDHQPAEAAGPEILHLLFICCSFAIHLLIPFAIRLA